MSHRYQNCPVCGGRPIELRNGERAIHFLADGTRCAGSGDPFAHIKRIEALEKDLERRRLANAKRRARERADRERDSEFEAAQAIANERRLRSLIGEPKPKHPFDRKIYATRGVHTVSGGNPGHGKRA